MNKSTNTRTSRFSISPSLTGRGYKLDCRHGINGISGTVMFRPGGTPYFSNGGSAHETSAAQARALEADAQTIAYSLVGWSEDLPDRERIRLAYPRHPRGHRTWTRGITS